MVVYFVIGGNPRVVHSFGLGALILEGFSSSQAESSSWAACSKDHGIPKWVVMGYENTVWCCYNVVNFLKNIHKRRPIAHLMGWGMGIFSGVYTKFSGRLSEEPFPWLIQKFPCILIFNIGQPGCQLNLSEGQIRLDLTSGRPLVKNPAFVDPASLWYMYSAWIPAIIYAVSYYIWTLYNGTRLYSLTNFRLGFHLVFHQFSSQGDLCIMGYDR